MRFGKCHGTTGCSSKACHRQSEYVVEDMPLFIDPNALPVYEGFYIAVYDPWLIFLSVIAAIVTSYGALRVSTGIQTTKRLSDRVVILGIGSGSLGGGIWSMHFVGMLAFSLPCGVNYDLVTTLVSMFPGVLAAGIALHIISRPTIHWRMILAGGLLLGLGIGTMHYTGMAALRMDAVLLYHPLRFALSIVVAVLLAAVALAIPFMGRRWLPTSSALPDLLGAVVMGGAISGMHYTAMGAAYFVQGSGTTITGDGLNPGVLAAVIVVVSGLVVGGVILGLVAYRYRDLSLTLSAANERLREISTAFDTTIESVMITGPDGKIRSVNPAFCRITGFSEPEVKGQNPRFLKSGLQSHEYYERMWFEITTKGHWQGEIWNRRKSGEVYPQWLTISTVKDKSEKVQSYVAVASDISAIKRSQEELNCLLYHNKAILNSAGEGIIGISNQGEVAFVNPAASAMLGWSETDMIGLNAHATIHHTHADGTPFPVAACPMAAVFADGKMRNVGNDFLWRKDGTGFPVEYTVAPVINSGLIDGTVVVFRDTTERQRNESKMKLAAWVFEFSPEGIVIVDRRRHILTANHAFLAAFNYTMEDLEGRRPTFLFSGATDRPHQRQFLRTLGERGTWEAEVVAVRKTGAIFPAWLKISAFRGTDGCVSHYVGAISDMSEAKSAQEQIEYLSRYDPLTALPNMVMMKNYFDMARDSSAQSGNSMALIYCDLDNFKHINDTLGHNSGDDLLKEIANRLKGCVAIGTGDIVCRSGGDEFVILLIDVPDWEAVNASIYAMRAVVSVPVQLGRHPISVTASIGISRYPEDGQTFDLLLQKADAAAYHAKKAGRNTARLFEATMIDHATERLTMKNDLRLAIERNEFLIHYQPLVDLESRRIVGAEALLRWQSPEHGFVPPVRFIPIAEESGLIVPIGEWVLRQVCCQGKIWRDAGYPDLRLAVNISAIQLHGPNFVDDVKNLVANSGFPPGWLELELTESVLISEADHTINIINELKEFGIKFAIDDFGTGYSCLSYLHNIMADKLKIDRSFVKDLGCKIGADTIITTIINMANTMGMTTLAEGVETEEQAYLLRQYGCKDVQGYFFGRPVPTKQFSQMIDERRAA
ncbi:diguanylate cyclase [Azospirillaceae bacterium]